MLAPDELSAAFPRLRPPRGSAALYTNAGGVVNGQLAAAVLRAMAQRAGAVVAPACLLGWHDAGGHFALRTAPLGAAAPAAAGPGSEGEAVYECEQLVSEWGSEHGADGEAERPPACRVHALLEQPQRCLASRFQAADAWRPLHSALHPCVQVLLPDAGVQQQSLALFGLALPGAQLWRLPASRWRAQEECAAVPLWQLLGAGSTRTVDDPAAIDSAWGMPLLSWAPGSAFVAQCLPDGSPAGGAAAHSGCSGASGGGSPEQPAAAGAELGEFAAYGQAQLAEERPGTEEAIDAERQRHAEQQRREEAAARRLATAGGLAAQLVSGIGTRVAATHGSLQLVVSPDGEPAAGSHPGFEAGRVAVAFSATAAQLGRLPGDQLAPLVARLAVDELLGRPPVAVNAAAVALAREALAAEVVPLAHDSWAELGRCLPESLQA